MISTPYIYCVQSGISKGEFPWDWDGLRHTIINIRQSPKRGEKGACVVKIVVSISQAIHGMCILTKS